VEGAGVGVRRFAGGPAYPGRRPAKQAELADRLGVSRQTMNAIENGKYDPSLPLAFGIASLFELWIEDVFDPDGKSAPGPT